MDFLWSYTLEYPKVEDKRPKIVYQHDLDGVLIAILVLQEKLQNS